MPSRNFILRPLGIPIAASLSWQGAPKYSLERAGTVSPSLKLAGTGLRLSLGFSTKSGNNFVAGDFAVGMPDREVDKVWFFFPNFACLTPGAGGEVSGTSTITIQALATRASDGKRTPGEIEIVSTTQNGQWVKFTPASPIPAGVTQSFAVAQQITDGTFPRPRTAGVQSASIFGGIVPDERGQHSSTSLVDTLSGSANYNNSSGFVMPSHMLVETPVNVDVALALGDSQEYGADMTVRNFFSTARKAFGWLEMGLDNNTLGQRIQHGNFFVSGWGYIAADTTGSHANAQACARQLSILTGAVSLNGGRAVADFVQSGHGTNSASGSVSTALDGLRAMFSLFKAAAGMPANASVCQWEMDAYPESSDGYNSLAGQKPQGSPTTNANVYPDGARWGINAAIGGSGVTVDTNAPLFADGTIDSAGKLWPMSSFNTGNDRDVFSLRDSYTMAANYSSGNNVSLNTEPPLGDYIAFHQSGTTTYAHVTATSGTGPYTVTVVWPNGAPTSLTAASTTVRSTWSGGGLHSGALGHAEYAFNTTYGVAWWKNQNGFTIPDAAPAITASSITGTPQDGEVLTANATVTGSPAPTLAYQWQRNGSDLTGETSSTLTLDASGDGWAGGDTIVCEITASNGVGADAVATPSIAFVVPVTAPVPVLVDSVKAGGSAGTVTATGLVATGSNRKIVAGVTAGTSDAVNDISVTIEGTTGPVSMTRVFLTGSLDPDPSASFEATAGFVIDEASLPGDGPYTLVATATGSNTPDKLGLVAGSVSGAAGGEQTIVERSNSVTVPGGTTITTNTFTWAILSSAQANAGATMTGATQVENETAFGDTIQIGWTATDPTGLTVTGSETVRPVSALILMAPN